MFDKYLVKLKRSPVYKKLLLAMVFLVQQENPMNIGFKYNKKSLSMKANNS